MATSSKTLSTQSKVETKRPHKGVQLHNQEILRRARGVLSAMTKVENKVRIIKYTDDEKDHALTIVPSGYSHLHTKETELMMDVMRSLFRDKHYEFRLSTALNMSSSAGGIINSTISNSVLTSQVDFVALSTVFNEFFIRKFVVKWEPNSMYNYPLTGVAATSVSSLPIGKADLQHGQAAYTSLSLMSDNFRFGYHNTGRPFTDEWVNTEKISTETVVTTLTAPTQSWCTVNNVANYQGTLQFLSQAAPPGLAASQVIGTFIVHWDCVFRVRA